MSLRADLKDLRKTVKDVQRILNGRDIEKKEAIALEESSVSTKSTKVSGKGARGSASPPKERSSRK